MTEQYLRILSNISTRYFIVAGLAFFIFYILLYKRIASRKLQPALPKNSDYLRELGYSMITMSLFALIPLLLLFNPTVRPYTSLYSDIQEKGWAYYLLIFPVMALMHDTYFYWTHRLMHHPKLYRVMHSVHHASTNPSPWAAYSFHPTEAVIEIGIFIIFIFTLPVHRSHIFIFFLFSITYNVYGHLGWELYSEAFQKSRFGRWINTSRQHNLHHKHFKGNYGLYFLFWDRWMGTYQEFK